MTKKLFLAMILIACSFAFSEAQAAGRSYCNHGTAVKGGLFSSKDGSKTKVSCFEYADQDPDGDGVLHATTKDKELKSFTGISEERPLEKCLTECVGLDPKTAKEYKDNSSTPKAKQVIHDKPTVDTPKKKASAVPDKSPFCSEGQKKGEVWISNCGKNDNGYQFIDKFKGKTQEEAVLECGRMCLKKQKGMLRQSGNGTWR